MIHDRFIDSRFCVLLIDFAPPMSSRGYSTVLRELLSAASTPSVTPLLSRPSQCSPESCRPALLGAFDVANGAAPSHQPLIGARASGQRSCLCSVHRAYPLKMTAHSRRLGRIHAHLSRSDAAAAAAPKVKGEGGTLGVKAEGQAEYGMTDEQRFFFDLKGWICLPAVLSPAECAEIMEEIDGQMANGGFNIWESSKALQLIDHPAVVPILTDLLAEPSFVGKVVPISVSCGRLPSATSYAASTMRG